MIRLVRREQLNIMENGERGIGNWKYCEFSVPHSLFPILRGPAPRILLQTQCPGTDFVGAALICFNASTRTRPSRPAGNSTPVTAESVGAMSAGLASL